MFTNKSLVKHVVARLTAEIEQTSGATLPPMAALCRKLRVSKNTLVAAADILRRKGMLFYAPRQPMRITGRTFRAAGSADSLYGTIRERIVSGMLKVGGLLPKTQYTAIEEGVSGRTVLEVYHRLVRAGLVHRQGKSWVVGPGRPAGTVFSTRVPTVVILQGREAQWGSLGIEERTVRFCRTFSEEAEKQSVRMACVVPTQEGVKPGPFVYTPRRFRSLTEATGSAYLGTLVVGSRSEIVGLDNWFRHLLAHKKPVVWFDRYGEGTGQAPGRTPTTCRFAQERGEELAARTLVRLGHTRAAYWSLGTEDDWSHRRGQRLVDQGAKAQPPLEIAHFSARDPSLQHSDGIAELLARCDRTNTPLSVIFDRFTARFSSLVKGMRRCRIRADSSTRYTKLAGIVRLIRAQGFQSFIAEYGMGDYDTSMLLNSPLFCRLAHYDGATAIIAPNDAEARHAYLWLGAAGFVLPRDISLLSFDNYWQRWQHPISTIDFGFGHLGYCAFHVFLGDIPIRKGRGGTIESEPYVVNRGTLGPPPRR